MTRTKIPALVLAARTAADVMTPNPITVPRTMTVKEAAALLLDQNVGAVPVVDEQGQPLGVLSRSDIVQYEREHLATSGQFSDRASRGEAPSPLPDYYQWADVPIFDEFDTERGFEVEVAETTTVDELMTPIVYSVELDTPIREVIEEMLTRRIHRLFVTNRTSLVGVVTAIDILRHLMGKRED